MEQVRQGCAAQAASKPLPKLEAEYTDDDDSEEDWRGLLTALPAQLPSAKLAPSAQQAPNRSQQ